MSDQYDGLSSALLCKCPAGASHQRAMDSKAFAYEELQALSRTVARTPSFLQSIHDDSFDSRSQYVGPQCRQRA